MRKNENTDSFPELTEAINYVREQLDNDVLTALRAQRDVLWARRQPIVTDYDDDVHDLLAEWGEEHGHLSDEWWSESIELPDIIVRI